MIEKADRDMAGGNTKYTAGAMRFSYETSEDLLPLLATPKDSRIARADFGSYTQEKFTADLLSFNDGAPLSDEQKVLVSKSYDTMLWLASHGVTFNPIWSRQSFEKDGQIIFWGGLTLAAESEGVGLFDMELTAYEKLGGVIRYNCEFQSLKTRDDGAVIGVTLTSGEEIDANAVILACGGFESNPDLRANLLGAEWRGAKVRGTPHNTGDGLLAAWALGAQTRQRAGATARGSTGRRRGGGGLGPSRPASGWPGGPSSGPPTAGGRAAASACLSPHGTPPQPPPPPLC